MNRPIVIAVAIAALATPCSARAGSVFSDGTFTLSEWTTTRIMFGNGGVQTEFEHASGGNPGSYLEVVNSVSSAGTHPFSRILGVYIKNTAEHDPLVDGSITSINYSEDALLISGFGNGQGIRPALQQDGNLFLGPLLTSPAFAWQPKVRLGLLPADFYLAPEILGVHPDFSASGSPIRLGFARLTTTASGGFTIIGGIDNWKVDVISVPEPGTLVACGIVMIAGTARQGSAKRARRPR